MLEVSLFAAFVAGVITFLAPCTLPLVPGYLGFVSDVPLADIQDPERRKTVRWKIVLNGFFFTLGFSIVFIVLGTLIGLLGSTLTQYQGVLNIIGGLFIIGFGLLMLDIVKIPALQFEHRFQAPRLLQRGKPSSSFVLGAAFGTGWTPCVGPVLGAILTLGVTLDGALQGAFLLTVYSVGLSLPFWLIALSIGSAAQYIQMWGRYLRGISIVGGLFLIFLGVLLFFGKLHLLLAWGFAFMEFIGFGAYQERLYDFL